MNSLSVDPLTEILLYLEYPELTKTCIADKKIYHLCSNDRFWKLKTQRDYPETINEKEVDESWREFYHDRYWKMIKVYHNKTLIDKIPTRNSKIWDKIREYLKTKMTPSTMAIGTDKSNNPVILFVGSITNVWVEPNWDLRQTQTIYLIDSTPQQMIQFQSLRTQRAITTFHTGNPTLYDQEIKQSMIQLISN